MDVSKAKTVFGEISFYASAYNGHTEIVRQSMERLLSTLQPIMATHRLCGTSSRGLHITSRWFSWQLTAAWMRVQASAPWPKTDAQAVLELDVHAVFDALGCDRGLGGDLILL